MPTPFPPELLTTFRAMAEVVYAGESYDSVYEALCHSAVELVDGCDHASLMLRRGGRVDTVAASDEIARRIDELEKALGEGPCLDAIDEDRARPAHLLRPDHGQQVARAGRADPRGDQRARAWPASGSGRTARRSAR